MSKEYKSVEQFNQVSVGEQYKAVQLKAKTGSEWNSIIRNYYLIEEKNSVYLIEMQYFTEAAEGYGARMQAMLDTFKIN